MTTDLRFGDCLSILPTIPTGSVDFVFCDLPYGSTKNKWDILIPFESLWGEYRRVAKATAVFAFTASHPFTALLVASKLDWFKYEWIWEKSTATGHLNAKRMPMKLHENILIFSSGNGRYFPQGLVPYGKVTRRGGNGGNFGSSGTENFQEWTNYPRSILRFPLDADKSHPTQKPVALMEYLIKTYSNEGETVLDNCMGSGTTGVAAVNLKRNFIGIEKDEAYFGIAKNRIGQLNVAKG